MKNYFLNLHKAFSEKETLPQKNGLCWEIMEHEDVWDLLKPTEDERIDLALEGLCKTYWGSGLPPSQKYFGPEEVLYTPLRQTIILFCHEILNRP